MDLVFVYRPAVRIGRCFLSFYFLCPVLPRPKRAHLLTCDRKAHREIYLSHRDVLWRLEAETDYWPSHRQELFPRAGFSIPSEQSSREGEMRAHYRALYRALYRAH